MSQTYTGTIGNDGSLPLGLVKLGQGVYTVEINSGQTTLLPFKAVVKASPALKESFSDAQKLPETNISDPNATITPLPSNIDIETADQKQQKIDELKNQLEKNSFIETTNIDKINSENKNILSSTTNNLLSPENQTQTANQPFLESEENNDTNVSSNQPLVSLNENTGENISANQPLYQSVGQILDPQTGLPLGSNNPLSDSISINSINIQDKNGDSPVVNIGDENNLITNQNFSTNMPLVESSNNFANTNIPLGQTPDGKIISENNFVDSSGNKISENAELPVSSQPLSTSSNQSLENNEFFIEENSKDITDNKQTDQDVSIQYQQLPNFESESSNFEKLNQPSDLDTISSNLNKIDYSNTNSQNISQSLSGQTANEFSNNNSEIKNDKIISNNLTNSNDTSNLSLDNLNLSQNNSFQESPSTFSENQKNQKTNDASSSNNLVLSSENFDQINKSKNDVFPNEINNSNRVNSETSSQTSGQETSSQKPSLPETKQIGPLTQDSSNQTVANINSGNINLDQNIQSADSRIVNNYDGNKYADIQPVRLSGSTIYGKNNYVNQKESQDSEEEIKYDDLELETYQQLGAITQNISETDSNVFSEKPNQYNQENLQHQDDNATNNVKFQPNLQHKFSNNNEVDEIIKNLPQEFKNFYRASSAPQILQRFNDFINSEEFSSLNYESKDKIRNALSQVQNNIITNASSIETLPEFKPSLEPIKSSTKPSQFKTLNRLFTKSSNKSGQPSTNKKLQDTFEELNSVKDKVSSTFNKLFKPNVEFNSLTDYNEQKNNKIDTEQESEINSNIDPDLESDSDDNIEYQFGNEDNAVFKNPRITGAIAEEDYDYQEELKKKRRKKKQLQYLSIGGQNQKQKSDDLIEEQLYTPEDDAEMSLYKSLAFERQRFTDLNLSEQEQNKISLRKAEHDIQQELAKAVKENNDYNKEVQNDEKSGENSSELLFYRELEKERERFQKALESERESNKLSLRRSEQQIQNQLMDLIVSNPQYTPTQSNNDPISQVVKSLVEKGTTDKEQIVIDATRIIQMIQNNNQTQNNQEIDEYLLRQRIERELKYEFRQMQLDHEKKMKIIYRKMIEEMYIDMLNS